MVVNQSSGVWMWSMIIAAGFAFVTGSAIAGPITFNSALPVSEGVGLLRSQMKVVHKTGDSTTQNRDLTVVAVPLVLVYGINSKLAVFGVLPYMHKRMDMNMAGARIQRKVQGLGDARFFGRYTLHQLDQLGDTFRIAPFAGIKMPTGSHSKQDVFGLIPRPLQLGSGSWDLFTGVAITRQTLDWEFDVAPSYRLNTKASDFEFGDEARLDSSYQYRVLPQILANGASGFTYAVLESNLIWKGNNKVAGIADANSGGLMWSIVPGLQYVTARYVLETTLQIPVVQRLNGTALEADWAWTAGFRMNF